jgi:tetratricopeptide (TPR) repeat protein
MPLYINRNVPVAADSETRQAYQNIHALVKSGKPEEAITALEKLFQAHPDFVQACNDLGVLYFDKGEWDKAQECYEKAVRLAPANAVFLKNLADYYYAILGRIEDALRMYVEVLTRNPEDIDALLAIGSICELMEQFDDAKIFYNRALEYEPWNLPALKRLESLQNS